MAWGRNASIIYTSIQGQQEIQYIDNILKKKLSNKARLIIAGLNIVFELDWQKKVKKLKEKECTMVLREIKNYFELAEGSSTQGKITVNVWRKSRANGFGFELAWGSS